MSNFSVVIIEKFFSLIFKKKRNVGVRQQLKIEFSINNLVTSASFIVLYLRFQFLSVLGEEKDLWQ